jgi:hypothetical protein
VALPEHLLESGGLSGHGIEKEPLEIKALQGGSAKATPLGKRSIHVSKVKVSAGQEWHKPRSDFLDPVLHDRGSVEDNVMAILNQHAIDREDRVEMSRNRRCREQDFHDVSIPQKRRGASLKKGARCACKMPRRRRIQISIPIDIWIERRSPF